jgi:hypothetical protein
MFYKNPNPEAGAAGAAELTSLAAVRCGDYKVYWLIDSGSTTPLPKGVNKTGVRTLDTPVIFDLSKDWSESYPLGVNSNTWLNAKAKAEAARTAHLSTLFPVVNQMKRGHDHQYSLCSDPDSEKKYPALPNCTISPDNWEPPICLVKSGSFGGDVGDLRGDCISQVPLSVWMWC